MSCFAGAWRAMKKHCQYLTNKKLNDFLYQLKFGQNSIDVCDAVEKILDIMFPDGNFQYYHNILQYNCISKAFHFRKIQQYDNVLEELKKARHHAEEMTKINYQKVIRFTSPLFSLIEEEYSITDSNVTDVDDFIRCLNNNSCFDPIRVRKDFKALMIP